MSDSAMTDLKKYTKLLDEWGVSYRDASNKKDFPDKTYITHTAIQWRTVSLSIYVSFVNEKFEKFGMW